MVSKTALFMSTLVRNPHLKDARADLVKDAKSNGLSDAGAERLAELLGTYPVFL